MVNIEELSSFQRDILVAIAANKGQPGSASLSELRRKYKRPIPRRRFYRNCEQLENKSLIAKLEYSGNGKSFVLTEDGEILIKEIYEWYKKTGFFR